MEITSAAPVGAQLIQAYGNGGFTIAGLRHEGSVLIMPERTLAWSVSAFSAVTLEGLDPIIASDPRVELLILGSGQTFELAPPPLREALRGHGIAAEAMATPAACRTYNVLLAEDRRVAAALIAI
ncbi:MAG: MTH938/NDUFAF3 family protein [Pseudomonadota bacterium]